MAATQLHAFIRHLRSVLRAESDGGLPDAELLGALQDAAG